jgi:hypothetical protein
MDLFDEFVKGFAYQVARGATIPEEMTYETFAAQRKRDLQDMMAWLWEPPEITPQQTQMAVEMMDAILQVQTERISQSPDELNQAMVHAWNSALRMSAETPPAEAAIMSMYERWSSSVTQGVVDSLMAQMQARSSYVSDQAAGHLGLPMMDGFQTEAEEEMPTVLSNIVEGADRHMQSTLWSGFNRYGEDYMASPLVSGFEQGLSDRQRVILDAVNSYLVNPMLMGVEEALGIHSPSERFARYGRLSMEGYAMGMWQRQ